jgi:hypothetical protein
MIKNVPSPETRRLVILRGIDQDLTSLEIAIKMGVKSRMIKRDLMEMKFQGDPELIQAYTDKKNRALASRQKPAKVRNARFKRMTGMTFQEKNFENMVTYYQPELVKILRSKDESIAIMGLPKSVQRSLKRNEIINGPKKYRQISPKALDYLQIIRERSGLNKKSRGVKE